MHPLDEWIVLNRLTKKKFARLARIAIPTVYKIVDGKRVGRTTAIKIEIATERKVTVEMLKKLNGVYSPNSRRPDTPEEATVNE